MLMRLDHVHKAIEVEEDKVVADTPIKQRLT